MTRAEYLEFIEENLCFPDTGVGNPNPGTILYDHADMIQALHAAHTDYCRKVAAILAIDREYSESGGPEDRLDSTDRRTEFRPLFAVESEGGTAD